MKKIYQFGIAVVLSALLPSGVLFAGNGDGDGKGKKNQIVAKTERDLGTSILTLTINTGSGVDLNQVQINTMNKGATIKEINPVVNGIQVTIEMDPETFYTDPNNDGGVIIEIVGVDNITGVDASDGNNGTSVPTSFTGVSEEPATTSGSQNNPTGMHSNQPGISANPNGTGSGVVTTFGSGKKDISVYPNPVTSETNVVTVGEILGRTIQIMDLSGHIVMTVNVSKGSRQTVLNLSMLTPGVYVLMYQTEDGQTISKRIQKV